MRYLIVIGSLLFTLQLSAQEIVKSDLELIKITTESGIQQEKEMSGLFKIYQKHISEQLISDCIYEESCSHFSQGAIKAYGPIKGFVMTLDRLTRCSRASYAETPRVRINDNGKIIDHWDAYKNIK
ncbi:MAG: membrane protein insertion efficiency factor YidD [Cyclobacteriaceae bacterium]